MCISTIQSREKCDNVSSISPNYQHPWDVDDEQIHVFHVAVGRVVQRRRREAHQHHGCHHGVLDDGCIQLQHRVEELLDLLFVNHDLPAVLHQWPTFPLRILLHLRQVRSDSILGARVLFLGILLSVRADLRVRFHRLHGHNDDLSSHPQIIQELLDVSLQLLGFRALFRDAEHLDLAALEAVSGEQELRQQKHQAPVPHDPVQVNGPVQPLELVRPLVQPFHDDDGLVRDDAVVYDAGERRRNLRQVLAPPYLRVPHDDDVRLEVAEPHDLDDAAETVGYGASHDDLRDALALLVVDVGAELAVRRVGFLDRFVVVAVDDRDEDGHAAALLLHAVGEVRELRMARDVLWKLAPRAAEYERNRVPVLWMYAVCCTKIMKLALNKV